MEELFKILFKGYSVKMSFDGESGIYTIMVEDENCRFASMKLSISEVLMSGNLALIFALKECIGYLKAQEEILGVVK